MKKTIAGVIFSAAIFLLLNSVSWAGAGEALPPFQESAAYKQYTRNPKSELSKLIYLMNRFRDSDLKVLYDGHDYTSDYAIGEAKKYIARNYHKENAEKWIKKHAYRAQSGGGDIIYLKYSDGKLRPLRDVLIEELEALQKAR